MLDPQMGYTGIFQGGINEHEGDYVHQYSHGLALQSHKYMHSDTHVHRDRKTNMDVYNTDVILTDCIRSSSSINSVLLTLLAPGYFSSSVDLTEPLSHAAVSWLLAKNIFGQLTIGHYLARNRTRWSIDVL